MNIYIKAMEIGYNNNSGISYFKLKSTIETSLNLKIEDDLEYSFFTWVLENFVCTDIKEKEDLSGVIDCLWSHCKGYGAPITANVFHHYETVSSFEFYLKGSTVKHYLDYLELKESRIQSSQAFKMSIISIIIAAAAIIFSWFLSSNSAKPPFDVKIIDDISNDDVLLNKIDSLETELKKADNLISIYEQKTNN